MRKTKENPQNKMSAFKPGISNDFLSEKGGFRAENELFEQN